MKQLFLSFLAACLPMVSFAQENWQLSLSSGYGNANQFKGDNRVDFEPDTVYQFVANHFDSHNTDGANLYYQLYLSHNNVVAESVEHSGIDIRSYHLQFGGAYEWSEWQTLRPYIAATLGTSYYDTRSESGEPFFSGTLGIGSRYRLSPRLALKLEARAIGTVLEGDLDVFCNEEECALGVGGDVWWQRHITAGFSWSF